MSRLILHRAFGSPPARAALMLCDLIGLQPEIKEVNIMKMEHRKPEFIKLNPMGTVPVLQDGDFILAESHAIMKYLLSKYGGDKAESLYPSEVRTRALVDQAMFFDTGVFFTALITVAGQSIMGNIDGPSPDQIRRIEASYSVLEAFLKDKEYVATDHLTLADLSTGSTATAIQVMHKLDRTKYPRSFEWLTRLDEEHVFKTINAPGVRFFARMMTKLWEENKLKNKENKM